MKLLQTRKQFKPITKQALAKTGQITNVDELCGVVSIAMLLQWCGYDAPFRKILKEMESSGAYVEGAGTYLGRTAKIFDNMHYIRYTPSLLMYLLSAGGKYAFAASIKRDDSSHIVFVYKYDRSRVYYYDPNLADSAQTMSHKKWNEVSNKRAAILRPIS